MGGVGGDDAGQFRPFPRRRHKPVKVIGKEIPARPRPVLEHKIHAPRCPDARNGRRRKSKARAFAHRHQIPIQPLLDGRGLLFRCLALVPVLERTKKMAS